MLRIVSAVLLVPALLLSSSLTSGCDAADPAPVRTVDVRYQVGPSGQFGAVQATFVEYTGANGDTVRLNNVTLPFTVDVEIGTGTEVTLTAEVQAPANQSGLQIAIRGDSELLGSDSAGGFESGATVTNTLSLTRTLP